MAEAVFWTAGHLSVHGLSVLCPLTSSGSRAQEKLLPPARVGWDKQGCRSLKGNQPGDQSRFTGQDF